MAGEQTIPALVTLIEDVSQMVVQQVLRGDAPAAIEEPVLIGLETCIEVRDRLSADLDSGRLDRRKVDGLAQVLERIEQKLAFFQGCTMRRSASSPRDDQEAEGYAGQAEVVAEQVRASGDLAQLIEAYKGLEALEQRIAALRGRASSGTAAEPRVLDMPRARVLAARRTIGAALVALDGDDDGEEG